MIDTGSVSAQAYVERARELLALQQAEAAEAVIREGLRRFPGHAAIQAWLPSALLMQGKLRDGFREYETRLPRRRMVERRMSMPEWDGPIAGRSIMLWGEQGIGDEIQTGRFIRTLRDQGASRIYVACLGVNVRLFQQLGADVVVDREAEQIRVPQHDCWVRMWSIPYKLGLDRADISGRPYLSVEPDQAAAARNGGIGLVERGNPGNPRDANRSLPEGLLQQAIPEGRLLQPTGDTLDSLRQLADLDLLITVDTSWAHLAGAMGLPCWLLLPYRDLDWRWLRERSDTPWYESLRLFRQPAAGDWDSVLEEVKAAQRRVSTRRDGSHVRPAVLPPIVSAAGLPLHRGGAG